MLNSAGLQMGLHKAEKKTIYLPVVLEVLGLWVKSVCGWVSQFDNKWLSTLIPFLCSWESENWKHWRVNSLSVWETECLLVMERKDFLYLNSAKRIWKAEKGSFSIQLVVKFGMSTNVGKHMI